MRLVILEKIQVATSRKCDNHCVFWCSLNVRITERQVPMEVFDPRGTRVLKKIDTQKLNKYSIAYNLNQFFQKIC